MMKTRIKKALTLALALSAAQSYSPAIADDNTVNGQGMGLIADQLDLAAGTKTRSAVYYGVASAECLVEAIATSWYGGLGFGACTAISYGAFGAATLDQTVSMYTTAGKVEQYQKNIGATDFSTFTSGVGGALSLMGTTALAKTLGASLSEKLAEESAKAAISAWIGFAVCGYHAYQEGAEAVNFGDAADKNRKLNVYRDPIPTPNPDNGGGNGGGQSPGNTNISLDQYAAGNLNNAKSAAEKEKLKALQAQLKNMSKECKSLKAVDAVACLAQNPAVARAMNDKKLNQLLNDRLGKDLRGLLTETAKQAASQPGNLRTYLNGIAKKMAPSSQSPDQLSKVDKLMDEAKKDLLAAAAAQDSAKIGTKNKGITSADTGAAKTEGARKADANGNSLEGFSFDFNSGESKPDRSPSNRRMNIAEGRQSGAPGYGADAWENTAISLFDRVENAYQTQSRTLKLDVTSEL